MVYRICACLAQETPEKCIEELKAIEKSGADLVEHRLDYLEKVTAEDLKRIYAATALPILASNRNASCGGKFSGQEWDRIGGLLKAVDAGCEYIDIEIETESELKEKVIDYAHETGCKVIISMHDFSETPSEQELLDIMKQEQEQGADIGKIVTTARFVEDCDTVLSLIKEAKNRKFPIIAFAMGKTGKPTRIEALKQGAEFMFACIGKAVAPGQLSVQELREALKK